MTELLYYSEPYRKSVEAVVVGHREGGVVFDRTIFYPECGGQSGDRGSFGRWIIKDTQKAEDGTPVHYFEGELPPIGTREVLSLDWNHRYFYMKEHTAQHLLSSLFYHEFGIGTVAVHQGEDILTIETDKGEIPLSVLLSLEEKAIREIGKNRSVYQKDMKREDAESLKLRRSIKVDDEVVKVVFISELDAVACGGVHIASTGEIEELVYRGKETIRGHVRTMWSIGERAREYRRMNESAVKSAGKLLSASPSSLSSEIERLQKELLDTKRELKKMERACLLSELKSHLEEDGPAVYASSFSLEELPELASDNASGRTVFAIEDRNLSDEEFRWLIRILQKSKKTGTPISQRKKR